MQHPVSCCLEMALWSTLRRADQVSQVATGGLSASFVRLLMNFLACGPERPVVSRVKGTRLMCGYLSNVLFSVFLAMCPGRVLAAATSDGLQDKGATVGTSKYVTEPLRLKTMSKRTCSRCPFTTRVRAGPSCSICVNVSFLPGIWPLQHACGRRQRRTCSHSSGAGVDPLVWSRSGPLRFCWGRIEPHPQRWKLQDVATSISWLRQHRNSGPQPHTLRCWAA